MSRLPTGKEKGQSFRVNEKYRIEDPYMLHGCGTESLYCPVCKSVYYDKHWAQDEKAYKKALKNKNVKAIKCPACLKIEDHYAMGILKLQGSFLKDHRADILSTIKSEAKNALARNPLDRIIEIDEKKKNITISTTTEKLALKLGRKVNKAYKGNLQYQFAQKEKVVRLNWERDE